MGEPFLLCSELQTRPSCCFWTSRPADAASPYADAQLPIFALFPNSYCGHSRRTESYATPTWLQNPVLLAPNHVSTVAPSPAPSSNCPNTLGAGLLPGSRSSHSYQLFLETRGLPLLLVSDVLHRYWRKASTLLSHDVPALCTPCPTDKGISRSLLVQDAFQSCDYTLVRDIFLRSPVNACGKAELPSPRKTF